MHCHDHVAKETEGAGATKEPLNALKTVTETVAATSMRIEDENAARTEREKGKVRETEDA